MKSYTINLTKDEIALSSGTSIETFLAASELIAANIENIEDRSNTLMNSLILDVDFTAIKDYDKSKPFSLNGQVKLFKELENGHSIIVLNKEDILNITNNVCNKNLSCALKKNGSPLFLNDDMIKPSDVQSALLSLNSFTDDDKLAITWLENSNIGMSSMALCYQLGSPTLQSFLEKEFPGESFTAHPHDNSDLIRCYNYLEAVPNHYSNISYMSNVSPQWKALVNNFEPLMEQVKNSLANPDDYVLSRELYDNIKTTLDSAKKSFKP